MGAGGAALPLPSPRLRRRYAVLKTGHATAYTDAVHGGYAMLLERLLRDEGEEEEWEIFSVLDGDFSFMELAEGFEGFVITGSSADAHSDDEWVLRLCDALRRLHHQGKKLIGICFGHQVLARALGGATGRSAVGWELGVKRIFFDSSKIAAVFGADLPSSLYAIESHQDQVSTLPPGAVLLAHSERTAVEMFAIGGSVLGMQFHPEFSKDVMMDILQTRMGKSFNVDVANEGLRSLEEEKPDQDALKALCKTFLKGHARPVAKEVVVSTRLLY